MAGVKKGRRPPGLMKVTDREEIVGYLKELARKHGTSTLTTRQVNSDGMINTATIIRAFGGFSEALIQAGLKPGRTYKRNRQLMIQSLADLRESIGRHPSNVELAADTSKMMVRYNRLCGKASDGGDAVRSVTPVVFHFGGRNASKPLVFFCILKIPKWETLKSG